VPTLVFAKDFLDDFIKLEPTVRQKVRELPDKFEDAAHAGIHLEKLTGAKDDRVRTVRVDQFWRGVVVRLGNARYALLRVMAHDDANNWAIRQKFGVNPATGLVEILDISAVKGKVDAVVAESTPSEAKLFDGVRDRDFSAVGVDEELIPLLRRIVDEAELYAIANYLPPAQADAVLLLADGMDADAVWAELAKDYDLSGEPVDPEDIETALGQPGTRSAFAVTTNDAELVELLSGDFEAWRTFLHPAQRSFAYKPVFNGPAKVTGGAGTGKTVVAIHRARFLAQQLLASGDTSGKVLVATYTNSLAENLDGTLRSFCSPDEYRRIQVSTVDALARQVLSAANNSVRPIMSAELDEIADQSATMAGIDDLGFDGRFLVREWQEVVLARRLNTLPDYATSPRPGRGTRLPRAARRTMWAAIEYLVDDLARRGRATFLQIADQAAGALGKRRRSPFAHVVVDEAQDLHPAQWRLLRNAVAEGPNDLFVVGDAYQRIYDHRVSLSSLGIETRGRSRRLKINYRTSQQILSWALGILTGEQLDDLDGEVERMTGYRSALDGPAPTIQHFTTAAEEAEFVVAQIQEWLDEGVAPAAIGVAARTKGLLQPVSDAIARIGLEVGDLGEGGRVRNVRLGTMHSCKGLEFARLAVVGVNSDTVPLPFTVADKANDSHQHELDLQRERCLLYVACTRARDELVVTCSGAPSSLLPDS
jgi:superfamily I DNA/RNA helicase